MEEDYDRRWMSLAISLASRGLGKTWPNPSVGCVIVQKNKVVGRGITAPGGRPHAEKIALEQAGERSKGASVYLTLEPCSHFGETGPCVTELINAEVADVVVALKDPDPRVSGRGLEALKKEGINVRLGLLREEAFWLNQGFFNKILINRPLLTLKLASTFDGRIATQSGESKWITGENSRRKVHSLRAKHDAILIGGGTAREDNPMLNVRDLGIDHTPIRILVSKNLNIPYDSDIVNSPSNGPVWMVHGPNVSEKKIKSWEAKGAKLIQVPLIKNKLLDLEVMMRTFGKLGLTRILCEGGGSIAASLIQQKVVDRIIGFTGGKIFGSRGIPAVGALNFKNITEMPILKSISTEQIENDILHTWKIEVRNNLLEIL
tara:strand:+ start:292 stop:1419 length:1128 start_codon:yes stop_codon:yes gene_type:complete